MSSYESLISRDLKKVIKELGLRPPAPQAAGKFAAWLTKEFPAHFDASEGRLFTEVWPTEVLPTDGWPSEKMQYGPERKHGFHESPLSLWGGDDIQRTINSHLFMERARFRKARFLIVGQLLNTSYVVLDVEAPLGTKVSIVFFEEINLYPRDSLRRSNHCCETGMNIVEFLRLSIDDPENEIFGD